MVPKAGHAHHDDIGTHLDQAFVIKAVLGHDAGTKILHHHIADRHQTLQQLLSFRGLKVQGDVLLVAIDLSVIWAIGSPFGKFTGFDFDHLSSEIRQIPRSVRPGPDAA